MISTGGLTGPNQGCAALVDRATIQSIRDDMLGRSEKGNEDIMK